MEKLEGDTAVLFPRFDSLGEASDDGGARWPAAGVGGHRARVRVSREEGNGEEREVSGAGGIGRPLDLQGSRWCGGRVRRQGGCGANVGDELPVARGRYRGSYRKKKICENPLLFYFLIFL